MCDLANTIAQFFNQKIKPEDLDFHRDENRHKIFLWSGAFGKVYLATFNRILEPVAVKYIQSGMHLNKKTEQVLLKEMRNMLQVQSNYTVSLYGMLVDSNHDNYALVMEFMPNGCLHKTLETVILPVGVKTQLGIDICRGLSYIHEQNVIHRDVKAKNILLDSAFKARLSDFGQAHLVSLTNTYSNANVGTCTHKAPELFHPEKSVEHSADSWSCGITFFELMAEVRRDSDNQFRRLPFKEGTTQEHILFAALVEKKSPISQEQIDDKIGRDCPDIFLSVMKKMTEIEPANRIKPVDALAELQEYFCTTWKETYTKELQSTVEALGINIYENVVCRDGAIEGMLTLLKCIDSLCKT